MLQHIWDRSCDSLSPRKLALDGKANTLRKCLSSVNSVYDSFGVYCAVLLRALLFLEALHYNSEFNWDIK